MNIPGFTAERSLKGVGQYRGARKTRAGAVIPALPRCENCDSRLEYCATHGGRPFAACRACATGRCDSSSENPGGQCWYDPILRRRVCDL